MQETIKIDVNVADNGTTDKANKNAEQLRATLKSAAAAAESIRVPNATAAAREGVARSQAASHSSQPKSAAYKAASGPGNTASDTNLSRGLAGQTGASGRDFAAQAQGLGGLVHVYATFAANLYAVSAAFTALSKAADITNIVKGLDQLGAASGRSLGGLAKQMVLVTDGAISMQQAMTSTALASAGGLNNANILRMTEVAKKASLALGRDMPDSMDRLTKGIVKVQPELLDELGIMARVIPAHQAYAKAVGKSTTELTDFEKRQAFANAVLDEGERKFGQIKLDSNPYSKLSASIQNLMQSFLELINSPVGAFVSILADNSVLLALALAGVGKTLLNMAIPGLTAYKISMLDLAKKSKEYANTTRAASNQEVADLEAMLGKKDSAAAKAAEQAYQQAYNSKRKIRQLDESVVGKEVAAIAKKSPFDLTPGEIAAIKSKQKELAGSSLDIEQKHAKDLGNLYNSIGKAKAKSTQIGDDAATASYNADTDNTKQLDALKARSNAINQRYHLDNIKATTAETQATKGMMAAFSTMNAQVAAASGGLFGKGKITVGTGSFDKQGKEITEQISKLNALQRANETVAGSYGILKTQAATWLGKLSNFAVKYGEIGAIIAAVVAVTDLFLESLSSNSKEAKIAAKAFDNLTAASNMLNNVMKDLEDRDPLYIISTTAMGAKANAILEVSEAASKAIKAVAEQNTTANFFDRFLEDLKVAAGLGIFEFGLFNNAAKDLATSVSDAFKLASPGKETIKALTDIKELTGVDPKDQEAFKEYLNSSPDRFLEVAPKVAIIMQQLGIDLSNTASQAKELDDSFKIAGDTFTAILTSMQPSDDLAKLGFQSIDVSQKMAKAFKDPTTVLSNLVEISGNAAKLRFFDPEAASELYKASPKIKEMVSDISAYTSALERLKNEEEELKAERETFTGKIINAAGRTDKQVRDNQKQQADLINLIEPLKIKIQPYIDKINKEQEAVFARGSQKVADSIGIAFQRAKITEAKALAAGLGDTSEGIKTRAALEIKSIGLQIRELDAKANLAKVMDNLRIAEEESTLVNRQILLETIKDRNRKDGKTPTQGQLDVEQKMDSDIYNAKQGINIAKDMRNVTYDELNKILQAGPNPRAGGVGQARYNAAQLLQPGAAIQAGAAASRKELESQQNAVATVEKFSQLDNELKLRKDRNKTELERLQADKAILEVKKKGALYDSAAMLAEERRLENALATNKELDEQLDLEEKIVKAKLAGSTEDSKTTKNQGKAAGTVVKQPSAVSELEGQLDELRKRANAAKKARDVENLAEEATANKARLLFEQKLLEITQATANINESSRISTQETMLSLTKELNAYSLETLANNEGILEQNKEELRSKQALEAIASNRRAEEADFAKRSADLKGADAEALKAIRDLHNENIKKLNEEETSEKNINKVKKETLDIQRQANVANAYIADKLKLLEHEKALTQDIFEINEKRIDLDEQRLESAKQLNIVSMEYYNAKKAEFAMSKAQRQFDLEAVDLKQQIALAEEKLAARTQERLLLREAEAKVPKITFASTAFGQESETNNKQLNDRQMNDFDEPSGNKLEPVEVSAKRPKATDETQAEIEAKRALKELQSKFNKLQDILGTSKQQTRETKYLNDETEKTNSLLKQQAIEQQKLENNNKVLLAGLDLEKQRIDNAKALNYLSEEESIRLNEIQSLKRLDIQYSQDKLAVENEILAALRQQKLVDDAIAKQKEAQEFNDQREFESNPTGPIRVVPYVDPLAKQDADNAVKNLRDRYTNLDKNLGISKLITSEGAIQQQKIQAQNQLLKDQSFILQKLENSNRVKNAQLDLDKQRLDNAKALNRVSEETYIQENERITLEKAATQYAQDKLAATDAVNNALKLQEDITRDIEDAKTFNEKLAKKEVTGPAKVVPDQTAVNNAAKEVAAAKDKSAVLDSVYAKQQLGAQEAAKQSLELEKQNQLLKSQETLVSNLTTLFGDLGTAMGDYLKATIESGKVQKDLAKQKQTELDVLDQMDKGQSDAKWDKYHSDRREVEKKYAALSYAEDVKVTGLKAKNAKKFFDEKSGMYKLLNTIEKVSAAIAVGMEAKKLAASIAASGPFVLSKVPGIIASFMEQLGPWGIAAAGVALAAIGLSGPSGDPYETPTVEKKLEVAGTGRDYVGQDADKNDIYKSNGGGYSGDLTRVSTSIVDSINKLEEVAWEQLDFEKSDTLKALIDIRDNTEGFARYITASGMTSSGILTPINEKKEWGGAIGGGSSSANTTSAGVKITGSVSQMATGNVNATAFKNTRVQGSEQGLFGLYSKSWDYNQASSQALSQNSEFSQFAAAQAKAFVKTVQTITTDMGGSIVDANNILNNTILDINVNTLGTTAKEQGDQLLAQYGIKLDQALKAALPNIARLETTWQKGTESFTDFAVRVKYNVDNATLAFASMGKTFTSQVGASKEELSLMLEKSFGDTGKMNDLTKRFSSNFLTEAERIAPVKKAVATQLASLGYSYVDTKEEFKDLLLGFKVTDQASADTYASLLRVGDSFAQVESAAETAKAAAKALADSALDLEIKIYQLKGSNEALNLTRQKELDAMDASLRPRQRYLNALTDEIALRDKLKSAYDTTNTSLTNSIKSLQDYKTALTSGASSTLSPAEKYAQAKAIFEQTAAAAKATITTSSSEAEIKTRDEAVANLSKASDSFLANSKVMNASGTQYAADFAAVGTAIDVTSSALSTQQTDMQQQLGFLDKIAVATDTTAQLLGKYLAAVGVTTVAQASATASGSVAAGVPYPKYASGGLASGMSLVGEQGPELVDFANPGRVYSNSDTKNLFNNDALIAEVKALREEVTKLREDQKEQTGHLIATTFTANARNAEAINNGNVQALNQQNWKARSGVTVV